MTLKNIPKIFIPAMMPERMFVYTCRICKGQIYQLSTKKYAWANNQITQTRWNQYKNTQRKMSANIHLKVIWPYKAQSGLNLTHHIFKQGQIFRWLQSIPPLSDNKHCINIIKQTQLEMRPVYIIDSIHHHQLVSDKPLFEQFVWFQITKQEIWEL